MGIKHLGLSLQTGQAGAVTLIQRIGRSRESTSEALTLLAETLARRIGRYLTRRGYLAQNAVKI